jgi:hypothetical protein
VIYRRDYVVHYQVKRKPESVRLWRQRDPLGGVNPLAVVHNNTARYPTGILDHDASRFDLSSHQNERLTDFTLAGPTAMRWVVES